MLPTTTTSGVYSKFLEDHDYPAHSPGRTRQGLVVEKKRPVYLGRMGRGEGTGSYIRGAGGHKKKRLCKRRPPAPDTLATYSGLPLNP
jgi:hypothetical protein